MVEDEKLDVQISSSFFLPAPRISSLHTAAPNAAASRSLEPCGTHTSSRIVKAGMRMLIP